MHDHSHEHTDTSEDRLFWTMLLLGVFVAVEFIGGLYANSLALVADSGHQLADTAALALAWYAARAANKPATAEHSFGYHRFQVLAALINGGVLLALSVWIVIEAVRRFIYPEGVHGALMLAVACVGLAVNIVAFLMLNSGNRTSLNVRAAILHALSDLLGFAGAIAAALVIMWTGWMLADPILSVIVAALIIRGAWMLWRESWHILMQGRPSHIDPIEVEHSIPLEVPEVANVHHVHAWSLTESQAMVTLHACVPYSADQDSVLARIQAHLERRFDVHHSTIQIERGACVDDGCDVEAVLASEDRDMEVKK
ncbi:MAG TPA: cation diffusion facilitator family transporter [Gammaproteobacteria bacterium]|nr:cation diffusion facilitator family transporter [Gammaproteobacteria bacterium]